MFWTIVVAIVVGGIILAAIPTVLSILFGIIIWILANIFDRENAKAKK